MKNKKLWVSILAGIMALMLLLSLLAGLFPAKVSAAESSGEIKKQIDALNEEKNELRKKMKELRAQIKDNLSEMEKLAEEKSVIDQEIGLLNFEILNINDQIAAYNLLIADKQEELDEAKARQQELAAKNKARIRAMEENGQLSYWSVLFKANSFSDLLDRLNMIEEIAASDRRRLQEMDEAAKVVAAAREALAAEKDALETTKIEVGEAQEALRVKRAEADAILTKLNARGEEYQSMVDDAEADEEALLADIAKKEKEYSEAKERESSIEASLEQSRIDATRPTKPKPSQNTGNYKPPSHVVDGITWVMPTKYIKFTSPFGYRIHPVYKEWRFHSGVDLAAPEGTPIYASRSGTVTTAAWNRSSGYYVTVNHGDGFSTSYLHMTHYVVKEGQRVSAGQVIGYVGSTGVSTGNHLHFTVMYNGNAVNPADYINFY